MRTNTARSPIHTHEGARAAHINPEQQLRRSVLACLLWESEFYEGGQGIADRIRETAAKCRPQVVADLAVEARTEHNLRHAPLWLLLCLADHRPGKLLRETTAAVLQRADEPAELLALWWKDGRRPVPKAMQKGIADALGRFDAYQLAKYQGSGQIKLRDVLRLCHPVPKDAAQSDLWRKLDKGELDPPDTWEVALSKGADKAQAFESLLRDNKLGFMALLRNLRGMDQAGVDTDLIRQAILQRKGAHRVLPFRFIAAAKAAPKFEIEIDAAMVATLSQSAKLPGKSVVIIDVSGSMYHSPVSRKSDMDRALAACALGAICRELCEQPAIYATAGYDYTRTHKTALVPARRGMALVDAIYGLCTPLGGGGIFLRQVMDYVIEHEHTADRVIVITDEQDCDIHGSPASAKLFDGARHYMINVASHRNGVGYGAWTHVDGFSESVIRYIQAHEEHDHAA